MKKKLLIVLSIGCLSFFLGWQIYLAYKYEGNLIVNISNQSKIDTVNIELYLDGKRQVCEPFTNEVFHNYKEYVFKTKLKNHTVLIKTDTGGTSKEIKVNTFLSTWVVFDFYEDSNSSDFIFYCAKYRRPFNIE